MTTGDEEAESLVDNLFREVDDQFKDLEREYSQAREDLALAGNDSHDTASNALQSSNERFELMSQVATLRAEVSRQADELDERDRMLNELGDKIVGFEAEIAKRDATIDELHAAKQEALDERREQARLSALLDARAAERQELADVANRLQNERDHVQDLLTTALARFDEAEAQLVQMDDKVRHLEAARDTSAHEHDARAHELIESRAEMSKLADRLEEQNRTAVAANDRAEKSEALAERRSNEAGYLNRRIDALNDKLEAAGSFENDATVLRRELTMAERRITELERDLASQESEAAAASAAVDAIAERTSDYDELVAEIEKLKRERDEAWEAASGYTAAAAAEVVAEPDPEPAPVAPSAEVASLAERARELSTRRSNEAANAAQAAEEAAAQTEAGAQTVAEVEAAVDVEAAVEVAPDVSESESEPEPQVEADAEPALHDLEDDDVDVIEADLADMGAEAEADAWTDDELGDEPGEAWEPDVDAILLADDAPGRDERDQLWESQAPTFEFDGTESATGVVVPRIPVPAPAVTVTDTAEIPVVTIVAPEDSVSAPGLTAETSAPDDADAYEVVTEDGVALDDVTDEGFADESDAPDESDADDQADHYEGVAEYAVGDESATEGGAAQGDVAEAGVIEEIPLVTLDDVATPQTAADDPLVTEYAPEVMPQVSDVRKRTILPASLVPNTPEAVAFLLNQPGVIAIVDARSTCGRTGIRPSELFDRVAELRDFFDVPVEVVVTPVSTPIGGAPDLPAIGVHYVTGADTVADRIRALCMGFPADQPLVVIAGDDHVRRAAIGEEANVVEPSVVLNLATE